MNINKASVCGRITKDITLRTTQGGTSVASFSVATNYSWNNKNTGQKEEKVTFHNIVMWGKLAEIASQYLIKGQEVYIEGKIDNSSYVDKEQVTRYKSEIVASEMQMGQKPKNAQQPATPPPAPTPAPVQTPPPAPAPVQTNLTDPAIAPNENDIPIGTPADPDDIRIEDIPF